jgi:hypothetical protein
VTITVFTHQGPEDTGAAFERVIELARDGELDPAIIYGRILRECMWEHRGGTLPRSVARHLV